MRALATQPRRAGALGAQLALALALGGALTAAQLTRERPSPRRRPCLRLQSAPTPSLNRWRWLRAGCGGDEYPASGRCENCFAKCRDGQYCWGHGQPMDRVVRGCQNCSADEHDDDGDPTTVCKHCPSGKSSEPGATECSAEEVRPFYWRRPSAPACTRPATGWRLL